MCIVHRRHQLTFIAGRDFELKNVKSCTHCKCLTFKYSVKKVICMERKNVLAVQRCVNTMRNRCKKKAMNGH